MPNERDAMRERGWSGEEEWARRLDAARTEALQRAESRRRERDRLADALGGDVGLADRLLHLGLDRDSLDLVHVIPLVQLAWTDGSVAARERERVLETARRRGIAPGSVGSLRLSDWLEGRPPGEFFADAALALRAVLALLPAAEADRRVRDVVDDAWSVAAAAGGLLGLGAVTAEERALIETLPEHLRAPAAAAFPSAARTA